MTDIAPQTADSVATADPASARSSSAAPESCAELLTTYQGAVVHDLRGELNGLLLTVDFLRRHLASTGQLTGMVGESLGDLDKMRRSLTSTLNELDVVGHARKVVSGRERLQQSQASVSELTVAACRSQEDRARRREVRLYSNVAPDIRVSADVTISRLAIERVVWAAVEGSRKTDVHLFVDQEPNGAVLRVTCGDAKNFPAELMDQPPSPTRHASQQLAVALQLACCLSGMLGGSFSRSAPRPDGAVTFTLTWPAEPSAT